MTESDVQEMILNQIGVRIESEMARYVLKQIQPDRSNGRPNAFPIIGANARTGQPLRQMMGSQDFLTS